MGESINLSPQEVKKTIKETFDEICPYFMAMGMSYSEFWDKDPFIAKAYLKADEIRQKRLNEQLWLQGYYNYIAFAYVSPILNPFAKKGTKAIPYPSKPIPLTQDDVIRNEEAERRNRRALLKEKLLLSAKNKGGS